MVPRRHLEYEKVLAMLMVSLHCEVLQLLVEERHASTVSSGQVQCHHPIPHKLPFVDAAGDICLLHHLQVNALLGHPAEGRIQASTVPNLDAVITEPYHHPFFVLLSHLCAPPLCISIVPHNTYQWYSFSLSLYLPRYLPSALPLLSPVLGPGCLRRRKYATLITFPFSCSRAFHFGIGDSIDPCNPGKYLVI